MGVNYSGKGFREYRFEMVAAGLSPLHQNSAGADSVDEGIDASFT